jgi:DNA-binding GntR family transcriptional regulator
VIRPHEDRRIVSKRDVEERRGTGPKDRRGTLLKTLVRERPPPLATMVEERIREAIVFGELGLGEPISEDRIATALGTSRTPVREALAALQLQGLVEIRPQRGSFVFSPSANDVAELCEFRAMLETEALRLAHARAREATLAALRAAEAAMEAAEERGDALAAAKADAAFHDAFFAASGNRFLAQAHATIAGRVGAMRYFARRRSAESRRETAGEHRALIAAFADTDPAAAAEILRAHVIAVNARHGEAAATPAEEA